MKIHSNIQAIRANNALLGNENKLAVSTEKLSSGYKINHSKDNPAGLAIARRINLQLKGLEQCTQGAMDGISVVETAEGALAEVQDMLQRMNELAVKGSTGTITDNDRKALTEEMNQLQDEITRIAGDTEFNGGVLLDGTYDYKGYTNKAEVDVNYYSDSVKTGAYKITGLNLSWDTEGNLNPVTAADITLDTAGTDGGRPFPGDCSFTVNQDELTIRDNSGFEVRLQFTQGYTGAAVTAAAPLSLDITGMGGMKVQLGTDEGQELDVRIPEISLKTLGINKIDYSTETGCREALNKIDGAINYVSSVRSRLGAYQNRLEHSGASLDATIENMTSAYSRIMDVDMATEMTEYTKNQVLTQAGTTMLAQANERPSQVLQLLQ